MFSYIPGPLSHPHGPVQWALVGQSQNQCQDQEEGVGTSTLHFPELGAGGLANGLRI